MKNKRNIKIDKNSFSVASFKEQEQEEKTYWHTRSHHERLEALEITRQMIYGYNPDASRLHRVLTVVERT